MSYMGQSFHQFPAAYIPSKEQMRMTLHYIYIDIYLLIIIFMICTMS